MTETRAFFLPEGDLYVPTGLGASPWNRNAQGGVSLAGLVGHVVDRAPIPAPMQLTRLTIDIFGAIPLDAISAETRIVREGRRVQLLEVEFQVAGKVWLRATALRLRTQDTPLLPSPLTHAFPDQSTSMRSGTGWVESIPVVSDFLVPGPGACWVRFPIEVVQGEAISPLQSVALASDFGSGVASPFSMREWTFANLDISIHLTRMPRSDWLLIDATSESAGNGIAVAHTRLGDKDGMIGMAHQSIYLEKRV